MRSQNSWKSYAQLISAISQGSIQDQDVTPDHDCSTEQRLITAFSQALRSPDSNADALTLLVRLNISPSHYRQHLRYIAQWDGDRRRLLAAGGSFRLLEDLRSQGQAGVLTGLTLSGSVHQQKLQLAEHLLKSAPEAPTDGSPGWLRPRPNPRARPAAELRDIWLYPVEGLPAGDSLHVSVARALIARYLTTPGTVVDPMAGSGVIPLEASRLGHRAWASDLTPTQPFIAQHDLETHDLADTLDGVADLLVLHPPVRADLKHKGQNVFETRLATFIEHAVGTVKLGGHVVLVVSTTEAPGALQTLTTLLVNYVNPERDARRPHALHGHHLAVARDGSQAWHLLVSRNGQKARRQSATPAARTT